MTDSDAGKPDTQEQVLAMHDNASPRDTRIPDDIARLAKISWDEEQDLDDRLVAYEDIIDSEIGDTDLTRARNIEREIGLRQIYLKFEGANPSGTQKDRIAFAQAQDAMRRGFEAITVATCGNYGAAMAHAAKLAGLRCFIYIPEGYKTRREQEMVDHGAEILRVAGDYEATVDRSRERAAEEEFYDANPGGANIDLQLKAYGAIASEIYDDLRDAPAVVAVPVSNGTTIAGIHRGFASLYRRGKTSRMPRMVAGSSYRKNPIVEAFLSGRETCEDLVPESIRETSINEPLINWHSIDGDLALSAIRESGGWAAAVSDKSMMNLAKQVREQQGLNPLPASTAGLHALIDRHRREALPGDRYVVLLTGRR